MTDTPGGTQPCYGVMHVHTNFSDGGIDIEDVIAAAQSAELDFLFITDHNTIEGRRYQGYHGNLLVAVDVEVSPSPLWNHVIALGLDDYDDLHELTDPSQILDAIHSAGGVPWIPHPRGFLNPYCAVYNSPWKVWDARVQGLELSTFCVEWVESLRPWNFLKVFRNPARYVRGPHPKLLARWDQLNAASPHRVVSGYVGLDAHFRSAFSGRLETPAYEFLFRTHNILAWAPPRTGDVDSDLRALRKTLTDAQFMNVMTHVGGRQPLRLVPTRDGIEVDGSDGLVSNGLELDNLELDGLRLDGLEHTAGVTTRLLRDGHDILRQEGPGNFSHLGPGSYRVEVEYQGRLWALSNPLRVARESRVPVQTEPAASI